MGQFVIKTHYIEDDGTITQGVDLSIKHTRPDKIPQEYVDTINRANKKLLEGKPEELNNFRGSKI